MTGEGVSAIAGKWGRLPQFSYVAKDNSADQLRIFEGDYVLCVPYERALRKGWPDDLSNVYETSEIDRARAIDLPPSEAAEQGAAAERLQKLGLQKDTVPLTFDQLGTIEFVPLGQAADRCMAFLLEKRDEPSLIRQWAARNRLGLREFWAKAPNDALAVKKEIEKATA